MRRPVVKRSPPRSSSLPGGRRVHFFESPAEVLLYQALQRRLPAAAELVPQHPVGPFRVDLAIVSAGRKLAVEVDGRAHHGSPSQRKRDEARTRYLELSGWRVFRAWAAEVTRDAGAVARRIAEAFQGMPRRIR